MIILNSPELAIQMLEKKSSVYSDRPKMVFGGEMVGWNQTLVLTPYGDRFREYRRFMHQLIGGRTQVKRFHSLSEMETHKFLKRVLGSPDQVQDHIRQYVLCLHTMMFRRTQLQTQYCWLFDS